MSGTDTAFDLELSLPKGDANYKDAAFVKDFVNSAWWAFLGPDGIEPEDIHPEEDPVRECIFLRPGTVKLRFRTQEAATLALELDGLPLNGHALRLRRPPSQVGRLLKAPKSARDVEVEDLRNILGFQTEAFQLPAGWHEQVFNGHIFVEHLSTFAETRLSSHYDLLEVKRSASTDEILVAYRTRCLAPGSDKGQLTEAYRTLSSQEEKRVYDHHVSQFAMDAVRAAKHDVFEPAFFVLRNLSKLRDGQVKRIEVPPRHGPNLLRNSKNIYQRGCGADLCILCRDPPAEFLPSEVWVSGTEIQIRDVQSHVERAGEETDGKRATPDGAILTVPRALIDKIPAGDDREELVRSMKETYNVILTFVEDRMILGAAGGTAQVLAKAIAMIQSRVIWRASVQLSHGIYTAWNYAMWAERFGVEVVPTREPDREEAWEVLTTTANHLQLTSLLHQLEDFPTRTIAVVKALTDRQEPVGSTVVRVLTSRIVYHEIMNSAVKNKAICVLMRLWSKKKLLQHMAEFGQLELMTALWTTAVWMSKPMPHLMCFPSASLLKQQFQQIWEQNPDKRAWVPWNMIVPRISKHVHDLMQLATGRIPDSTWHTDPDIVAFVSEYLVFQEFIVNEAGVRAVSPMAPPYVAAYVVPPVMVPPMPVPMQPSPAQQGPPPAPPAPKQQAPETAPSKKARRSSEEFLKQAKHAAPEKCAELLVDASKEPLAHRMVVPCRELFGKIASAPAGTAQELRDWLTCSALDLVEAIGSLHSKMAELVAEMSKEKAKAGHSVWQKSQGDFQKCCLSILHAANLEFLDKEKDRSLEKKFWHAVTQEPFGSLLLTADCQVIPAMCSHSCLSDVSLEHLAKLAGRENNPHKEEIWGSLKALTKTATDLAAVEQICKYVKGAGFPIIEISPLLSEAARRICSVGPPTREAFWKAVVALQQSGVPQCLDELVQTMQAWGHLQQLVPKDSPADVAEYVLGAAARLEAPQLLDLPLFTGGHWKQFPLQNLASMAHSAFQIAGVPELRSAMLSTVVQKAKTAKHGALANKQARAVAELAAEHNMLNELSESPAMFVCMEGDVQELVQLPKLLLEKRIASHIVNSIFSARLLETCCSKTKADFATIMQHVQKSIRVLDDTGNLGCLKGFIFGLSRLRALQEHMKSGGSWDRTLPDFIGMLLRASRKEAKSPFQDLVDHVDALCKPVLRRQGRGLETKELLDAIRASEDAKLKTFRDMCGPSYLEAVLMNSGNVVLESTGKWKWREGHGGGCQASVLSLAGELANLASQWGDRLVPRDGVGSPTLLMRVTGEDRAEDEQRITPLLAGLYVISVDDYGDGGSPVFVKQYPIRDPEEHQVMIFLQEGFWWVGPEVGSNSIWAKVKANPKEVPTKRGWQWQEDELDLTRTSKVQIKAIRLDERALGSSEARTPPKPKARPITPRTEAAKVGNTKSRRSITPQRTQEPPPKKLATPVGAVPADGQRTFATWLDAFDNSRGNFKKLYLEKLSKEFGNFEELKGVFDPVQGKPAHECVAPEFWEVLEIKQLGHKLAWARQLKQLCDGSS